LKTVAIIGVGMMGGSLGLALRKRRAPYRIIGVGRNPAKLARAKRLGACHETTTDLERGVRDADIAVLCTAVSRILPFLSRVLPVLKPGAVATDIGSVKSPILDGAAGLSAGAQGRSFVGGHPLAGSEKTGVQNSSPDLYRGATVVLCPLKRDRAALREVETMWKLCGARTIELEPAVHDILVAQTSHLPHVLSGAFVQMVRSLGKRDPNAKKLLAGSFRDFTRISDSDPRQWAEIASANHNFLAGAVMSYIDILKRTLRETASADEAGSGWRSFFTRSKKARRELLPL